MRKRRRKRRAQCKALKISDAKRPLDFSTRGFFIGVEKSTRALSDRVDDNRPSSVSRNRHEHLQPEQMTTALLPVSRNRHMHWAQARASAAGETSISDQCREIDTGTGECGGQQTTQNAETLRIQPRCGRSSKSRPRLSISVEKSTRALSDRVDDDRPPFRCRGIDTRTCSPSR
jgi:hypothetical protein